MDVSKTMFCSSHGTLPNLKMLRLVICGPRRNWKEFDHRDSFLEIGTISRLVRASNPIDRQDQDAWKVRAFGKTRR